MTAPPLHPRHDPLGAPPHSADTETILTTLGLTPAELTTLRKEGAV